MFFLFTLSTINLIDTIENECNLVCLIKAYLLDSLVEYMYVPVNLQSPHQ